MMILIYYTFLLALLGGGTFCSLMTYLMLADAITMHKGRLLAVGGGVLMGCGAAACFATFLWLLHNNPFA
jgi:hypothetical protein